VAGYKVFRNGSQVGTATATSYTDTGLTPGTDYSYAVSANDAAGNESAQSAPPATAATMAAMDIASAKKLAGSSTVGLLSKTIAGVYDDCIYIEETDRFVGIKVVPTERPSGLAVGRTLDVGGTVQTNPDGEHYIYGFVRLN
jgi:hypothetical protein